MPENNENEIELASGEACFLPTHKKVKEILRWVVTYLLVFIGSSFAAALFYGIMQGFFPALTDTALGKTVYFFANMALEVLLAFALIPHFYLKASGKSWRDLGFKKIAFSRYAVYGLGGGIGLYALMIFLSMILPKADSAQNIVEMVSAETNPVTLFFLFICASFAAPLVEETVFRGLLYRGLKDFIPDTWAMIITGCLFGAIHLSLYRFIPLAVGGMILCFLYKKTDCLWVNITAHGIWNALMFLMVIFLI